MASLLRVTPARAAEADPVVADRSLVVSAWRLGGAQVRAAAEIALVGSDEQVREFLDSGWQRAQQADERDAVADAIGDGGPSVRAAGQRALDAADAGDQNAIADFLASGWQNPSDIDTRLSVNQVLASGGPQVREVAQQALDSEDPAAMREFLDSGWQVQWQTDQRLRVNQAMATGGPNVKAAGQKALDAETPEALEEFLAYGWAVASAHDEETESLTDLLAQAEAAGTVAEQETQQATEQADRAKAAADAARRSAADAARATQAAHDNMAEAAAQAKRAATAANKAAQAARVAVQAAAAASRAAQAASTAAARAASAASRAGRAASAAYKAAAVAATDRSKAGDARKAAEAANAIAQQARGFADKADQVRKAIQAGLEASAAATVASIHADLAAQANNDAVKYAKEAGADASAAQAAAQRAVANAGRAARAAAAAEKYLRVAIRAATAARDAARRAADNAEAAARAAIDAAEHAGEAAQAAQRATEHATAATAAAQDAVDAAAQAGEVYEAAREADAERLAVATDEGREIARDAADEYEAQERRADWDTEQAKQRDAETNRLIGVVGDPTTDPTVAVAAARKVALNLAGAQGAYTKQAAQAALSGTDLQVMDFVLTGVAQAAARDDRQTVMNLAITDNKLLADAAIKALAGTDAEVSAFLRTQNYPGRLTQDRLKVNQILATAIKNGDVVTRQRAQEALDAETLQALRDFLDTGQYVAAETGDRVRVNQIIADPDSGPEVTAAAQVALEGPPTAVREFLDTGRYTAAERDYEGATHLSVVGGLIEKINQVSETAVQNAMEAQAVAARARGDAAKAADYANQAAKSAEKAAGYAVRAQSYADQAAKSVDRAAAAVKTARDAATRANASARSAIRSAAWAVVSYRTAVQAAAEAHAAAERAREAARAAGADSRAANQAGMKALSNYFTEIDHEVGKCFTRYAAGPAPDLEHALGDEQNEYLKNCVEKYLNPDEAVRRAYANASMCGIFPVSSQAYQDCIHSSNEPEFDGLMPLIFASQAVAAAIAVTVGPIGLVAGALCMASGTCGTALGVILGLGDITGNLYKLIKGDQSLGDTLLNLGKAAMEALVLAGVGRLMSAGFQAIKAAYSTAKAARVARTQLQIVTVARYLMLAPFSCLLRSSGARASAAMTDDSDRPISAVGVESRASTLASNSSECRLVLGLRGPASSLAADIHGYHYLSKELEEVVGLGPNRVPIALWMQAVNRDLSGNKKIAVALDRFSGMDVGTVEEAKRAYVEAYRLGVEAAGGGLWLATPWEMYRIGFYSRRGYLEWSNIDWYYKGKKIEGLPEPKWVKDAKDKWWPVYE